MDYENKRIVYFYSDNWIANWIGNVKSLDVKYSINFEILFKIFTGLTNS